MGGDSFWNVCHIRGRLGANSGDSSREIPVRSGNRERRAAGLPPLKWNEPLTIAARAHAKEMARQNTVSHRLPGEAALPGRAAKAGAHFSWLSENIVQSRDAAGAHSQFMKSAAHKANLLDADMNAVGIGVVERHGQLFVVEDFAQRK